MQPHRFGHIEISTKNLEKSIDFYCSAFNCSLVFGPTRLIEANKDRIGTLCADKLGPDFTSLRLAILNLDNQHGIELFEFPEAQEAPIPSYGAFLRQPGQFIFSICCRDIEETSAKVVKAGGTLKCEIQKLWPDKEWKMLYCTDPEGNVIEILSHSFSEMWL